MAARDHAERVCIGVVTGAHGVRGQVRIRSFTSDPMDLTAYGQVTDAAGTRLFVISVISAVKDSLLAHIDGIQDRDQAQALRGTELYVARDALPAPEEEEYYHADLIGLIVENSDGEQLGRVAAVHNFGAGDVLEIAPPQGASELVLFTKEAFPEVDLTQGRLVLCRPATVVAQKGNPEDPEG